MPEVSEIKALSNDLRMRIYLLLRVEGKKTVGQICDVLSAPVGSVSYHMTILESAGLVEKAESPDGDKRKSWWKAREGGERPDLDAASEAESYQRREQATYNEVYKRYLLWQAEEGAVPSMGEKRHDAVFSLTQAEMQELASDIDALFEKWQGIEDAHDGSEDTSRVYFLSHAFRWFA